MSVVHQLKDRDHQSRADYCTWFQNFLVEEGEEILDVTFFTDEVRSHPSEYVNSQNTRLWSSENPHEFKEMALHDLKVGVWCAISRMGIIGPIFFNDTINAERYRTDILEPFLGHLTERQIEEVWFQQDGATAHTASSSLQFLEDIFGNRIISRGIWPARSPDLTPPDYYIGHPAEGLRQYEEACPDMSSGPWGTFPTSAVGGTATRYVVLYCTVSFGTICIRFDGFIMTKFNKILLVNKLCQLWTKVQETTLPPSHVK
jgi:hypothetical protein